MLLRLLMAAALAAAPLSAPADDAFGLVTSLEGEAFVYRDGGRFHAAEGVHVKPGDLLHTMDSALVQTEPHPESDPILLPEKYLPKDPPPAPPATQLPR